MYGVRTGVAGSLVVLMIVLTAPPAEAAKKKALDPWSLGVGLTWPDKGMVNTDLSADGSDASMLAVVPLRGQRFVLGHLSGQFQLLAGLGFGRDRIDGKHSFPDEEELEGSEYSYDVVLNALDLGLGFRYYLDKVKQGEVVPFLGAGAHNCFVWGDVDYSVIDDIGDRDLEDALYRTYERVFDTMDHWGGQVEGGATWFVHERFDVGVQAGLAFDVARWKFPKETFGDYVLAKDWGTETVTGLYGGLHAEARF